MCLNIGGTAEKLGRCWTKSTERDGIILAERERLCSNTALAAAAGHFGGRCILGLKRLTIRTNRLSKIHFPV